MLPGGDPEAAVSALEGLAGSTRVISSIDEVHASEWDAIVLSSHLGRRFFGGSGDGFTRRDAPVHLNAIVLLTGDGSFQDVLEDGSKTYIRALGPHFAKGRRATISDGLADELEFLVRQQLVPAVAARDEQHGLKTTGSGPGLGGDEDTLQPFLIGPDDMVYAAKYERVPGSSVWVVPDDVPDIRPWFRLAFAEWHRLDPETYFGAPDWFDADKWFTPAETTKSAQIAAELDDFAAAQLAHEERLSALERDLAALRAATAENERLLIAGQNLDLQAQVRDALVELGFGVEDMDLQWDPREPREDFRIRDSADATWMVIGDATGTTKGVKGVKLMTTERFVTKYVADNPGQPIPNFWLIANHFAERDPDSRPADLVRGDELGLVEASGSLVLDTVALFHMLMAARVTPTLKASIRGVLRSARGQFTAKAALDWIEANAAE